MDLGLHRARRAGVLLRALAAVVLVAACSVSPAVPASAPGTRDADRVVSTVLVRDASGPGATHPVLLRSRVTRVAGRLSDVRRDQVARALRATVQDYLDGAFDDAPGQGWLRRFQAGLRRTARTVGGVLEQPGGARAGRTTVVRAAAWFSVVAPAGRPVGATARLRVEPATGSLTGRLLLTRAERRWQVFGYDLARSGASAATRTTASSGTSR